MLSHFFKPTSLKFPFPVVKLILNDSQCLSLTMRVGPSRRHDVHGGGGTSRASPSLPGSLWGRRSCNHPTGLSPRTRSNLPAARAWLKQWLCVFPREKGRKGWEKEKTRVSHVADAAQSSEASILNCSVQWHETYGRGGGGRGGGGGCLPARLSPPLRFFFFFPSLSSPLLQSALQLLRYQGCLGLSSFIKESGVSESLWCFLSRGASTLLQRVHEGERMYPPLGSTGWWEPAERNSEKWEFRFLYMQCIHL